MPRLCQIKKLVPVRPPDRALQEKGQDQLEQCEEIEEASGFHREKVERPG